MIIMLRVLGYIFAFWLLGSFFYSIFFHVRKWLQMKRKIQRGKVGEMYKFLFQESKWRKIVLIQLIKIFISLYILSLLK